MNIIITDCGSKTSIDIEPNTKGEAPSLHIRVVDSNGNMYAGRIYPIPRS